MLRRAMRNLDFSGKLFRDRFRRRSFLKIYTLSVATHTARVRDAQRYVAQRVDQCPLSINRDDFQGVFVRQPGVFVRQPGVFVRQLD